MKGMVFTEFLDMVEDRFSLETVDAIIDASQLASGGAYTTVGTYDHQEMVQLVSHLSQHTGIPVPDLLQAYGQHLFTRFVDTHSQFFEGVDNALDFLMALEDYIHVEVRKLYPGAELPRFLTTRNAAGQMEMTYRSARPFADFAHGLLLGCIDHFQQKITVQRVDPEQERDDGRSARFLLTPSTEQP